MMSGLGDNARCDVTAGRHGDRGRRGRAQGRRSPV